MKFSISSSFNPCGTNIEPMQLVKKHFVLDLDIGFGGLHNGRSRNENTYFGDA